MLSAHPTENEKKLICFIDDSAQERELFEEVFGGDEGAFQVICAETSDEARAAIGEAVQNPDLFVLDLYFPGGDDSESASVDLNQPVAFTEDDGDLAQAFLNLESARKRYQALRISMGQSPAGGLKLIEQVQEAFPGVPIVTYTRKGTIEESEAARQAGARRVLQKPSGEDWETTVQLTMERQLELERSFRQVMGQDPYEILSLIVHYTGMLGSREDRDEIAQETLKLRRKLQTQSIPAILPDDVDRLMECTSHPFIRALIFQLRPETPQPKTDGERGFNLE